MDNKFKWIEFYTEFADALLPYKNDRTSLIKKIQKIYDDIHMTLAKMEINGTPKDIDPFTIYGLFNKGITDEKRKIIINAFIAEFSITSEAPDDFSGIPVLMNMSATFYAFEDTRKEHDIDNLWDVFEAAIELAKTNSPTDREKFCRAYNLALAQSRIKWNLTMALYWIRPYDYLSLDAGNREFMKNPEHISENVAAKISALKDTVPSGEEYLELRDKCLASLQAGNYSYDSFPALSRHAWINLNKKGEQMKRPEKSRKSKASFLKWFRPIIQALRELGGSATPTEVRKKIIENERLSESEVNKTRGKSNVNKFENEVAFARSYLVKGGYIDNKVTGVWTLTDAGKTVNMTDELASEIFKNGVFAMRTGRSSKENALGDADVDTRHVWLYAPGEGASMWEIFYAQGIMALGWPKVGDLSHFTKKEEVKEALQESYNPNAAFTQAKRMLWQLVHDMRPDDMILVKKGRSEIVGMGIVASDYEYDDSNDEYPHTRKVQWTHKGSWESPVMLAVPTLTDLTNDTENLRRIFALFETEETSLDDEESIITYPTYTSENFLNEVYVDEASYKDLVELLRAKKNVILTGAPGVGKTFIAKRLAYSIMGVKDVDRVMMVQFHQSYSYEDFIIGIRPSGSGFSVMEGVFYKFCKRAADDTDNDYFFIIDEINRGNLSKIFGELFMLIESDKRGSRNKIQPLYADQMFYIPDNLYIIGMMNTADRSLAMLDYALRRRFGFFALFPAFSSERFKAYQEDLDNRIFDRLIACVEDLNREIEDDESLGEGFCIGHSYFCNIVAKELTNKKLSMLVEYELIPMLKEYWFDEPHKTKEWSRKLRSAVQ